MKGILTDQSFVAGIGNACADEVCRRAELHPFRRRPSPSDEEVARLYEAMRSVLAEAADTLEARVGDEVHVEARDCFAAHGKAGEACRRCGGAISKVTRSRRTANFCRTCQPGLMVARRERAGSRNRIGERWQLAQARGARIGWGGRLLTDGANQRWRLAKAGQFSGEWAERGWRWRTELASGSRDQLAAQHRA